MIEIPILVLILSGLRSPSGSKSLVDTFRIDLPIGCNDLTHRANVWRRKLWRISHQKFLAGKSLANLASFAFLIVHTIDNLDYRRANVN